MFANKLLRKIFGNKRDEIIGQWRKLHNAELHASRRPRLAGHVARMEQSTKSYRVLMGKSEGKRP